MFRITVIVEADNKEQAKEIFKMGNYDYEGIEEIE